MQGQVSLRDDADDTVIGVHDGNPPDLMLLHQSLTVFDILAIAARDWIQADEFFDGRSLGIQSVGDNRTAEIAIGNHANEFPGLLIGNDWNRADVSVSHHHGDALRAIVWSATGWVLAHYFSNFHDLLLCLLSRKVSGLSFNLDFVHHIAVARIGFCYPHRQLALAFCVYGAGHDYRAVINLGADVGVR